MFKVVYSKSKESFYFELKVKPEEVSEYGCGMNCYDYLYIEIGKEGEEKEMIFMKFDKSELEIYKDYVYCRAKYNLDKDLSKDDIEKVIKKIFNGKMPANDLIDLTKYCNYDNCMGSKDYDQWWI